MARQIVVEIVGDSKKFTSAVEGATTKATGFSGKLGSIGKGFGLGAGIGAFNAISGAAGDAVSFLSDADKAFQDDAAGQAQLGQALKNNIPHWDGSTKGVEDYVTAQGKLGFKDDDVRASIAQLVGVTHNQTDAMKLNSVAQDLARSKGISLAAATDIVTKAHEGNGKALKGLGIDLGGAKDAAGFLDAIQKNVNGSAKTWAATNQGQLAASNIAVSEAMESVGGVVDKVSSVALPILADALNTIIDVLTQVIAAVQPVVESIAKKLQPVIEQVSAFVKDTLIPVLGQIAQAVLPVLSAAIGALGDLFAAVFPVIVTIIQSAVDFIRTAITIAVGIFNGIKPVLKVVGDVVKSVFGFIGTFIGTTVGIVKGLFSVLSGIFDTIKPVLKVVSDVVKNVFGFIATVIKNDIDIVTGIIGAVSKVFTGVVDTLNTVASNIGKAVGNIVGFFSGIGDRISGAVRGMWDGLWVAFKSVVNSIIRGWNSIQFSMPSVDLGPLGHVGGFTIGTPNIPYLHQGGIVPGTPGSDVPAILQAGERVIPRSGAQGGNVTVNIGHFIGSGRDVDRFVDLIAERMRLAG